MCKIIAAPSPEVLARIETARAEAAARQRREAEKARAEREKARNAPLRVNFVDCLIASGR